MLPTVAWKNNLVVMIDQRKLPGKEVYIQCRNYKQVVYCIKTLAVRGAPAIGVAAAYGVALAAVRSKAKDKIKFYKEMAYAIEELRRSRPTAVNLFWALDRMTAKLVSLEKLHVKKIIKELIKEAKLIEKQDIAINAHMAKNGAKLFKKGSTIMTICNTGVLATAGIGTAFGVLNEAHKQGKKISVVACETRPLLQGSRLTAWELKRAGIPFKLITDNMACHIMSKGFVKGVIAGADRITANGDTANKIGTYMLAVLAKNFRIPFFICAPKSTIDLKLKSGRLIPIEERKSKEVTEIQGVKTAPDDTKVFNPAFDVTPNELIAGIITEAGVVKPPFIKNLKKIF
ncbi:MAG: S-methyl-5-thioribose-1-phosphate isomerase [Candidatus Firestonebacteria bacterium RIFOXYC2_FULL_39_67]|nr:MAG: S-methyl-5-thioribose-1-phosphate isomerase [Candidatus Firestonebacteria bacterium RIFOXYD2_FULL_39_29]OGF53622.1 MAG: S-methyl-5-thioribose-1-phosphate isomerase [Candidatus Firestonebacteria bacterium RifOxyC12_full_39_7]OGF54078.1 MAG: S-methyl-5-thioribose-1-phosphate isomerase [Candidatus Firestonebacteria bacterium RIFOXYC2_FULL_39_67]